MNYPKAPEAVSKILLVMADMAKPGVMTIEINNTAESLLKLYNAKSYIKGYKPKWATVPFPTVSCISVNGVIAHGIPTDYKLVEGDIVSFDLGLIDYEGNCGDAALTVGVGKISNQASRLLYYAKKTLYYAISLLKKGVFTQDVARDIEHYVLARGFKVNRRFAGHRIDREMHLKPNIYNTTEDSHVYAHLVAGQKFCVEPMLTNGRDDMGVVLLDGWQTVTSDGKLSAVFEHMVQIETNGCNILTSHITIDT